MTLTGFPVCAVHPVSWGMPNILHVGTCTRLAASLKLIAGLPHVFYNSS